MMDNPLTASAEAAGKADATAGLEYGEDHDDYPVEDWPAAAQVAYGDGYQSVKGTRR